MSRHQMYIPHVKANRNASVYAIDRLYSIRKGRDDSEDGHCPTVRLADAAESMQWKPRLPCDGTRGVQL